MGALYVRLILHIPQASVHCTDVEEFKGPLH